ncbi:DUF4279 domain-containing protein [Nocardia sp. NPDC050718]|uniref:DUF4279 domain-containing protein n=1 Tax=Nocardia sp. NPDC050718 TaxID=3155788 RepID=UPI0033E1C248
MIKIRQYSYFALYSETMTAVDLTAHLGVEPDETRVFRSKSAENRIPRSHSWQITRHSTESIDEQIEHLIDRLTPHRPQLLSLLDRPDVEARMQVVRHYDDPDGVHGAPGGTAFADVHKWPRPLGWHLTTAVLEFLVATRAELDVDEYN